MSDKLSRDEIRAMEAGREMDALIAKWVMGKPEPEIVPIDDQQFLDETYDQWSGAWRIQFEGGDYYGSYEPVLFSTDIAAAWQVIERMRGGHEVSIADDDGLWGVDFITTDFRGFIVQCLCANAPTVELAICRAALLAVMEEG